MSFLEYRHLQMRRQVTSKQHDLARLGLLGMDYEAPLEPGAGQVQSGPGSSNGNGYHMSSFTAPLAVGGETLL